MTSYGSSPPQEQERDQHERNTAVMSREAGFGRLMNGGTVDSERSEYSRQSNLLLGQTAIDYVPSANAIVSAFPDTET